MNKEEIIEVIKNFHRVYYSIDDNDAGRRALHHAACHLFDAAEITSSICADGENEALIARAKSGLPPTEALEKVWEKINSPH